MTGAEKKSTSNAVTADTEWLWPLLDAPHTFIVRVDAAGHVLETNAGASRFFGSTVQTAGARIQRDTTRFSNTPSLLVTYVKADRAERAFASILRKTPQECLIQHPGGRERRVLLSAVREAADGGETQTAVLFGLPVSRRSRIESDLRESQARFERLSSATFEGIVLTDKGVILDSNEVFREMFGYTAEALVGMSTVNLVAPEQRAAFVELSRTPGDQAYETVGLCKNGDTFAIEVRNRDMPYQGRTARIGAVRDISDAKRNRELLAATNAELQRLAVTDGLTGLDNRRAFDSHLDREIANTSRYGPPLSLVLMDVDHFKQYNDEFGHVEGDAVLERMATILTAEARITDFPARYGGEEFAIILSNTPLANAWRFAERCREAMHAEHWPHIEVTASFGIAGWNSDMKSPGDLIHAADEALYEAKRQGRNRVYSARP